jgi:predicted nuclease of predicted toxin-antitoxin system
MKFLCDVHISYQLCKHLKAKGIDVIHINSILEKWNTKDDAISKYADENDLVIITKDADFKNSYFLKSSPRKLIRIVLGNISNEKLISLIDEFWLNIILLEKSDTFIIQLPAYLFPPLAASTWHNIGLFGQVNQGDCPAR